MKYLNRLIVMAVLAGVMTVLGIMTMGLAETIKFGVIGLAAAGGLMLLLRVMGGPSAPPSASGKTAKPKRESPKK